MRLCRWSNGGPSVQGKKNLPAVSGGVGRCRSVSVGVGRCRSVVYCLLRFDSAAAEMASLICFTTHLRSACLSGSVRKCATSSLICCVRNLSEIVLRRIVSGFRMLRRMLPADAVICAC